MKGLITGVALASAAALAVAAPAQAAPKDPLAAVKKQLVAGKGVSFTEATTYVRDDGPEPYLKRTGRFMFGKGKVAATDMASTYPKETLQRGLDSFQNDRTILIGKSAYLSGRYYDKQLPEGEEVAQDRQRGAEQQLGPADQPGRARHAEEAAGQGQAHGGRLPGHDHVRRAGQGLALVQPERPAVARGRDRGDLEAHRRP
ncbi:hypothetical protein [Nonomuraea sp. NPDC023979]|uniref:hypothetical protein n=1 Tax=Nonomuraea sp. NPDC023979 TaxID=3154796 RepID=UPI00340EC2AA